MQIDAIYREWILSIDLAKTRVLRSPSFVFLCGGPTSGDHEKFKSGRDIFFKYIKQANCSFKEKVIKAEDVFRYFEHSAYDDLFHFERDLAELSALTVIFSESPGSIAELGSFAVLSTIQERLLVVVHENHANQESFIWRGPILYINAVAKKNKKDNPISVYEWKIAEHNEFLTKEDFPHVEDLAERIESIISSSPQSEAFRKNNLGHVMLLMLDLLRVIQLATLEEIKSLLNMLGIDYDTNTVKQQVSLLRTLKLIERKTYGNNIFYLCPDDEPWLAWSFQKAARVRDLDRWRMMFTEFYSEHRVQKHRALGAYLKSVGKIGD